MRLDLTPYCRLIGAMQIYNSKLTREDEPAPEIRWIIGKKVRIIGFSDFNCSIRLSVARLNGEDCHVLGDGSTDFFTEVPVAGYLDNAARDTEVIIDTKSSQSHLSAYTDDFEYKIRKVRCSEPIEFRQKYLPVNQYIAEGSIQRKMLYMFMNLCPDDTLEVEVADGSIRFVSESRTEDLQIFLTDVDVISPEILQSSASFSVELLNEVVKNIPKNTNVRVFISEEFIRFRYKLGEIGYMNYYQRRKNALV